VGELGRRWPELMMPVKPVAVEPDTTRNPIGETQTRSSMIGDLNRNPATFPVELEAISNEFLGKSSR
jgi:hypothetical protein